MDIITRSLPVRLTRDEHEERARQLAEAISLHDEIEVTRKRQAAALKADQQEAAQEIRRLAQIVERGAEPRQVECRWNPAGVLMLLSRLDTGELVETRAMTAEELRRHSTRDIFDAVDQEH